MPLKFISKLCSLIGGLLMALDYMVGVDRLRRIEQLLSNELSRIQKFRPPKLRLLAEFLMYIGVWGPLHLFKGKHSFDRTFEKFRQIAFFPSILLLIILAFGMRWGYLGLKQHNHFYSLLSASCVLLSPLIVWCIIKLLSITVKALARLLSFGPKGTLGTIGFVLFLFGSIADPFLP